MSGTVKFEFRCGVILADGNTDRGEKRSVLWSYCILSDGTVLIDDQKSVTLAQEIRRSFPDILEKYRVLLLGKFVCEQAHYFLIQMKHFPSNR